MPKRSYRKLRVLILILVICFVAIQFIRPGLDNAPVTADLKAPPPVKAVLQRACYDCHSNETKLLWFDQLAPAYWLVVEDVKEGRKALNFSGWDSLPKAQQAARLFESIFQIEQQAMPLSQYKLLHHGAALSPEDLAVLKDYALTMSYQARPDTAREQAWKLQQGLWRTAAATPLNVANEYNGISYGPLAGFANWTVVSTTERYDNGTLRLILGNDVVVKAIREGHTDPWPDGSIFAKVAWDQLADTSGEIRTGAFKQVEFMIRDQEKYASTFGWGWARWVGGLSMKPYGKDASFVTECMNCHRPLDKTDHTFTFPLADTQTVTRKVITTFINRKDSTMSTLYGNDIAVQNARNGQPYGAGAVVSLVTWLQREDPHWFGGRIPGALSSIEILRFSGADTLSSIEHQAGKNLTKRTDYSFTGRSAAVMP